MCFWGFYCFGLCVRVGSFVFSFFVRVSVCWGEDMFFILNVYRIVLVLLVVAEIIAMVFIIYCFFLMCRYYVNF